MENTNRAEPKVGGMFIRNYLRPVQSISDSDRARVRLARLFHNTKTEDGFDSHDFAGLVEDELGVKYPRAGGYGGLAHEAFWTKSKVEDILSAITIWFHTTRKQSEFLREARRIFLEENLRYRIDDKGGVHFLIDAEFERNVAAAVAGLGSPRFAASLHAFQEAMKNLGTAQQSGKGLIRGVFEAVESAFLAIVSEPSVDRLNGLALDKYLKPLLVTRYASHGGAEDLAERFMNHFKAWVKSAHPFRHGTPFEQIHEAPLDLAVMSATQGIGYLRFLASLQDRT